MRIGVPKEIKTNENRVALVPAGARSARGARPQRLSRTGGGRGQRVRRRRLPGGRRNVLPTADEVWGRAELIMKVKEPIEVEWPRMRKGSSVVHLFPFCRGRTPDRAVIASEAIAVAYETVSCPAASCLFSRRCPRLRAEWRCRPALSI
jgi:alanine dehydrogenase